MNIKQFGIVVDRYLAGKASVTEIKAIDQWLDESGENTEVMTDLKRRRLQEEILQKIRQSIPNKTHKERGLIIKIIKPYLRIAAMLAAFTGMILLYQNYQKKADHPTADKTYETYSTPKGRQAIITLSDGSVVQLNAATVLKYPKHFQGKTREVILEEGEAFFEITPNPHKPFIVHAAHQIDTRVLGTSFNISSYRASDQLTLSVNTGRVQVTKVTNKSKRTMGIFTPGQGLTYNVKKGTFKNHDMNAADLAAWKNNILILKDADFNELKQRLENWYGIEISLQAKSEPAVLFTGRYYNKSLQNVLQSLQRINHFRYELKGKKLIIENNAGNRNRK
ncbi:FecR family protein [Pedobacter metabolipauper]|uniref:FecR family protein n=1 Tax=Pedobacter metabolipauper TaxID=425513 RepID=A0A4R6SV90_9SPHI|nr:FecR family protein [Pedobacter metabolipauper]TDQ08271.1 FecR family protein [Pedobacter metabolipauper]